MAKIEEYFLCQKIILARSLVFKKSLVLFNLVHFSFVNRSGKDFDILDGSFVHSQWILLQYGEVSQLPTFNGAHDVICAHDYSGVLSDGFHTLIRRDFQVFSVAVALCCDSVYSTPGQKKRL